MHTAKCPAKVLRRFIVFMQVTFPLDFFFPDPVRLIPMQLREPYASGHEANARDSLHLTPSAFPVASAQSPEVANSFSCCDRLDNGDLADDLKVHFCILPLRREWRLLLRLDLRALHDVAHALQPVLRPLRDHR